MHFQVKNTFKKQPQSHSQKDSKYILRVFETKKILN
jgi:hypothetical protein